MITYGPITTWPGQRTPAEHREYGRFKTSWDSTLALLEAELGRIAARNATVELAYAPHDWRLDGRPRAQARPEHPGVVVRFASRYGDLAYATDHFHDHRDNLRAIALGLHDLRRLDRYGIANRGEQYRGWAQLEAPGPSLTRGRELITQHGGVREALRATHPDHGGDAEAFADVQAARESGVSA